MKKVVLGSLAGVAALVFGATSASAETDLNSDTVICFKNNVEGEEVLTIVSEAYFNRKPNAREVKLAEGKSACIRYHRAKVVKPYYAAKSDLVDGKLTDRKKRAECRKTKAGFAKAYVFERNASGKLVCTVDVSRDEDSIRDKVKDAKAINAPKD